VAYPHLFEPYQIKDLILKNRIVMPAIGTNLSDRKGNVTPRALAYYLARANGGVGLITTEAIPVNLTGKHRAACLCLFEKSHDASMRHLTSSIHEAGSKVAIQLHHAGRLGDPEVSGQCIVSASEVPVRDGAPIPKALNITEIKKTVTDFACAAQRAKNVGFDAIEIHGAHGYLIHQFFSPRSNRRMDAYGGNLKNRMRFPLEIAKAVRDAVGDDFPIIFRLSVFEGEEGGYGVEEALGLANELRYAGIDVIHVSAGTAERPIYVVQPRALPEACLVQYAQMIKKEVGLPVITVGRIARPEIAEESLRDSKVDLVAMGRALLADPEWPTKVKIGMQKTIRPCIACNRCLESIFKQEPICCSINPLTGFEYSLMLKRPRRSKKVAVVGAGPAGLEAACTAASIGHRVVLYERENRIGGQLWAAAAPPHKSILKEIITYYESRLAELNIRLQLGREVTEGIFEAERSDILILASGSRPICPSVRGVGACNALFAQQVLLGSRVSGQNVMVIGGGLVGSETAEFLAEQGRRVTLVEMLDDIALNVEPMTRMLLLKRLGRLNVNVMTRCKLESISRTAAIVEQRGHRLTLPCDSLVFACGFEPNNQLESKGREAGWNVKVIGDCKAPGTIKEAVHEGFLAVYNETSNAI